MMDSSQENSMGSSDGDDQVTPSLRLELAGDTDLKDLGHLLQQNLEVTDIDVCVHDTFTADKSRLEIIQCFELVGSALVNLRKLEFYPGTGNYNEFHIEAMTATLRQARHLEVLYVYHLELIGDHEKFKDFARLLQGYVPLKEFCFIDCQIQDSDRAENQHAFDPIVRSLGSMPSLEVVALWANYLGRLTAESLEKICASSCIERLMLLGFNLTDDDASRLFDALHNNTQLKRLNLSCNMGARTCRSLSRMLQGNASLEKIKIEVDTLEDEDGVIEIANGLKMNSAVDYFKLSGVGGGSDASQKAFTSMLEKNTTLETLSLLDGKNIHSPLMDFFLKLNRKGRRRLIQGAIDAREPWLEALVASNGDLDCLFYFMSMNPSLCFH